MWVWDKVERSVIPMCQVVVEWRLRVYEILQFGHVELTLPNHSLAWADLVTISLTHLNRTERKPVAEMAV